MRGLISLLKKYYYVIIFVFLEIIAFILLGSNNSYQHSKLVNVHREISGSIQKRVEGTRLYLNLKPNNASLNKQNARLLREIEYLKSFIRDSSQVKTDTAYSYIEAKVINATVHKQFNYLTLDKGRKDSVLSDMAVIGPDGIVGIILESSKNFSTVLPVINRDFRLSVKIKRNNFSGILSWEGQDPLFANIHEIPYHADVNVGDTIITSGYSALFPEGIFVGTIDEFALQNGNFYNIKVKLGTDFHRIYNVIIIKNLKQEEQSTLEALIE